MRSLLRPFAISLVAILSLALLPLAGVVISTVIADVAGCPLNEGGSYPCIIFGSDIGGLLSFLFVAGWLMLVTIPVGGVAFGVWVVALVVTVVRHHLKHRA
ncbi:hypothetical protein [Rhizobium straminoryzae]|uniref:Uncharacterized protein n=1 Tax=Rhizobium straminoryzae TaxID=1387186 RepID=A0A549TG61_9HYPH|nr:hypothetical protein [Rhizobium straminoryzae]TRL41561.1 hypothetical protein FNA46_04015 [Rhizobium straminoryzae]